MRDADAKTKTGSAIDPRSQVSAHPPTGSRQRAAAWAVHVFTGLGSLLALSAILAVFEGRYEWAFGWLFLALVVDAVDGTFARAVDVERHLPRFSGERLDLVIDYMTYVLVPVLALLRAGFLPGIAGYGVAGLILLSSLYHFADTESKTEDNCFVGFPAVWNMVAFCVFALAPPPWLACLVALVLCALAFVPMRWLHPMRVERLLALNIAVTLLGLAAALCILWYGFPAGFLAGSALAASALYFVVLAFAWPRAR